MFSYKFSETRISLPESNDTKIKISRWTEIQIFVLQYLLKFCLCFTENGDVFDSTRNPIDFPMRKIILKLVGEYMFLP